jgi:predicted dinucleotide-binding enzyme
MLPLIAIGLAVAALAAIVVAIIKFAKIKAWLRERQNLKQEDKDVIAFTIKKNLDDGNYEVVKGFFNTSTDELLDGEKEQSKKIDDELEQIHNGKELVLYE